MTSVTSTASTVRWLHLSDFHVGKDNYGQRRLFKYLLDHIHQRVVAGNSPDLVFITGDLANKGQDAEYREFYDGLFWPLLDQLPTLCHDRIFIVPGNRDVDRTQARAVYTYDVLLRVPEFLDPTEKGCFERRTVFPRFWAFASNDLTQIKEHWLFSQAGVLSRVVEIRGQALGIVGLNTAWLSCSDEDRNRLSPGKGLLEQGLETLQHCDLKIVLGHHPLDRLLDTDLPPMRSLLGRHMALYLHGHMHEGRARHEEGAGYPFLALQSGACFQAREHETWVSRILWCELDLVAREVSVEPLQWSRDYQEWSLDGTAFPDRFRHGDRWVLPLPSPTQPQPTPPTVMVPAPIHLQIPDGWTLVDTDYLAERNVGLSTEQALSFFDGRAPIWREALAPEIPPREVVQELVTDLEAARGEGGLRVTLLTGAAGEGKTTVLLQTVCELVAANTDWCILWHYDSGTPLPAEFLVRLPSTGTWLIVSDDAELIARRVFDDVQALRAAGRRNVQFLLCCRDTDWKAAKAHQLNWRPHVMFVEKWLRGISRRDAQELVAAWRAYGREGLKTLYGLDSQEAVQRLARAARSESIGSHEGTFFGAVLQVRWGEGLKEHIADLLRKLEQCPIVGGKTLRDAFAYIAAPHAGDILILSKVVLAEALACSVGDLKRTVLGPLGEEAVIATTGRLVFTRHRAIAKATVELLSDMLYEEVDELYVDLVQAALRARLSLAFVPNMQEWNYLSSHFFEKGNLGLGIRLAQAALQVEPTDPYLTVKLAQLFREAGQPEQAVQVFRTARKHASSLRGYYREWGAAEGSAGRYGLNAWLAGFSLCDQAALQPPANKDAKIALSGLSLAFRELYDDYNAQIFIEACGGAAQLGFLVADDPQTRSFLERNAARARAVGVEPVLPSIALARICDGIAAAWEQREDELPGRILPGETLTFDSLRRLLRVRSQENRQL